MLGNVSGLGLAKDVKEFHVKALLPLTNSESCITDWHGHCEIDNIKADKIRADHDVTRLVVRPGT